MPCRACGFENVPDASSCGKCGAPLTNTVSCPACGRPPKQKFCNGCGHALTRPADRAAPPSPLPQRGRSRSYTPKHLAEKILTSRSALEGERKQEWHKTMDRFFAIFSDGVHRFEGTINQYTGDGSRTPRLCCVIDHSRHLPLARVLLRR
jgi:double zinc ribbon protein